MQQLNSAGRTTYRACRPWRHRKKAVAASVEWNMVRMDLLAHYKSLFLSYYDAMSFWLLFCSVGATRKIVRWQSLILFCCTTRLQKPSPKAIESETPSCFWFLLCYCKLNGAVVQVLQATSSCFIFKWSLITSLGLQVISNRKFVYYYINLYVWISYCIGMYQWIDDDADDWAIILRRGLGHQMPPIPKACPITKMLAFPWGRCDLMGQPG